MFRRMLVAVVLVALSGAFLSACSPSPAPYVATSEQPNPAPAPLGEPMETPPAPVNPVVVVSSKVDTTLFTQPAVASAWELSQDLSYAVVTIRLSSQDWTVFAQQNAIDPASNPYDVQLSEVTARSLIDVDQLAEDIMKYREDRGVGPIDIRSIEVHYTLTV